MEIIFQNKQIQDAQNMNKRIKFQYLNKNPYKLFTNEITNDDAECTQCSFG